MIKTVENFYAQDCAAPTCYELTEVDSVFLTKLDDLKKLLAEGKKTVEVEKVNQEIKDLLIGMNDELDSTNEGLTFGRDTNNLIDDKQAKKLLEQGKNISEEKITYTKNYQNVKSNEESDKKKITALFIVNFFILLVLLFGCYLVLNDKNFNLKSLIPSGFSFGSSSSGNRTNNNRNNNRNNNNNSMSLL